jgi:hypothetical protein
LAWLPLVVTLFQRALQQRVQREVLFYPLGSSQCMRVSRELRLAFLVLNQRVQSCFCFVIQHTSIAPAPCTHSIVVVAVVAARISTILVHKPRHSGFFPSSSTTTTTTAAAAAVAGDGTRIHLLTQGLDTIPRVEFEPLHPPVVVLVKCFEQLSLLLTAQPATKFRE